MNYCECCHYLCEEPVCPFCGKEALREVQSDDYCFLCEQDDLCAKMLMEIFRDNEITPIYFPVLGSGVTMKTGKTERYKIYVPYEKMESAHDLMKSYISE